VLEEFGVEVLGADLEAIQTAEDRLRFKEAMAEIGLESPRSTYVKTRGARRSRPPRSTATRSCCGRRSPSAARAAASPTTPTSSTMIRQGLYDSPVHEVLVEESVLGWKEYELEVMRDRHDNCVIICSIENLDAMGVHTGDSITVAPAMTLSDPEYQQMRDAAFAVLRRIGVETGGSNVQFAVDPATGRQVVIEMNPRVSRSSALASKATGFPIAKIAAKLAIGYTLDEIANDITRETKAAFEPSIDYVVVKIPRFAFEKFRGTDDTLTTRMKSVGEVMAIGRTFKEALNKALRSLEDGTGRVRRRRPARRRRRRARGAARRADRRPARRRRRGADPRLVGRAGQRADRLRPVVRRPVPAAGRARRELRAYEHLAAVPDEVLRDAKRDGFSDAHLAEVLQTTEAAVRARRHAAGIRPVFKTVDTCAAEFEAFTPYHYSTYEDEDEVTRLGPRQGHRARLRAEPHRAGRRVRLLLRARRASRCKDAGYETIMVNCNPETVSTDYDTADRLYFEPLTLEDVLEVCHREQPVGVLVQLGGQTPLKLAQRARGAGVPIWGTSPGRDRRRRGPRPVRALMRRARGRHAARAGSPGRSTRPATSRSGSATRCWSGPPTCSAAGRCRSSTTTPGCERYLAERSRPPPTSRSWSTGSSRARSRSTSTRCSTARAVRRRGARAHRGGRGPLGRLGLHAAADHARARPGAEIRGSPRASPAGSGSAGCSTSSSRSRTTSCTASRPTPARRGRCRSPPRPPACRWRRSPPG
jgi:carbamoyl-phosphate synthase large subunit